MPAPFAPCDSCSRAAPAQIGAFDPPLPNKAAGQSLGSGMPDDVVVLQIQLVEQRVSKQLTECFQSLERQFQEQQAQNQTLLQQLGQQPQIEAKSPEPHHALAAHLEELHAVHAAPKADHNLAFNEDDITLASPEKDKQNEQVAEVAIATNGAAETAAKTVAVPEKPPPPAPEAPPEVVDDSLLGQMRRLILSRRFETFSIAVIMVNSCFIGIVADFAVKNPSASTPEWMDIAELVFFAWFWSELGAKLVSCGLIEFFKGPDRHWNIFDLVLMVMGTIQMVAGAGGVGASVLRCLRAGRISRLAPFIKTNPFFKELRLMLYGTFACFRGLLWASLMLVSIMYLFGMVFLGAATGYLKDPSSSKTERLLIKFFGSLPEAIRTLFRVISGGADWYDASSGLWDVHVMYGLLFTIYIFFMVFGVLNVLVGVFVDSAMATANMDADILAQEAAAEKQALMDQASSVLKSVDKDASGSVSWDEFAENLGNPSVLAFLEAMQIHTDESQGVFEMVDCDGSGSVNIDEFLEACMKLKAGANLNTIVTLLYENKAMLVKQGRMTTATHALAQQHHQHSKALHAVLAHHFNATHTMALAPLQG